MATYFTVTQGTGGEGGISVLETTAGPPVALVAFRWYGQVDVTTNAAVILQHTVGGTTTNTPKTPEKANSRSPAAVQTYSSGNSDGTTTAWGRVSTSEFSHQAVIFSQRYAPTTNASGDGFQLNLTAALIFSATTAFVEGGLGQCRRLSRKGRKGYFFRYGNEIHHHQKTGGGAFNQICPHFDNDVTWVEASAWRNGMDQASVWNINIYGAAPPPVTRNRIYVT